MRRLVFLLALSACAAPPRAVTVEVPPPPPVERPALPPRPEPEPPPPDPLPDPPPPPAPAPKGVVEARSVYPSGEGVVAEWMLTDGTRVVYAQRPGAGGAHVVSVAPGGVVLVDEPAPTPAEALDGVRRTPVGGTVVVVGAESAERFESRLEPVPAAARPAPPAAAPPGRRVSVDPDDDGLVLVLAEALRRRSSAELAFDPTGPAAALAGGAVDGGPVTEAEAEAARAAAAEAALRQPEAFAARALADLFLLPGDRSPARAPSFALDRLRRVRAVTARRLSGLASRLGALPPLD